MKGEGNQQDYGMRIYDPRLGRFLSVDPLAKSYAWNSPYSCAENSPILFKDLDGLEKINYQKTKVDGKPVLRYLNTTDFYEWTWKPHWGGSKLGFTLWETVKNPRQLYVTHEATDGTWEQNDKVQFITYDQTVNYDTYSDMLFNKNGRSGGEKAGLYLAKGAQNAKEENRLNGGAGMYVNLFTKSKVLLNIYGEGESAGFTDIAVNERFANGRPLSSTLASGIADKIVVNNAPLFEKEISEIVRLSKPGVTVTYSAAEDGNTFFGKLAEALKDKAKIVSEKSETMLKGTEHEFTQKTVTYKMK